MLACGYSISLKQFHLWLYWNVKFRINRCRSNLSVSRFHFIYFSYKPDFDILYLSIRTLLNHVPKNLQGSITIGVDSRFPFDSSQRQQIFLLNPSINFTSVDNFAWASGGSTRAEIEIFNKIIIDNFYDNDYLVKVDSDIAFIDSTKWNLISNSGFDSIGDGRFVRYMYAQGGMYMLKPVAINLLYQIGSLEAINTYNSLGDCDGEDFTISGLLACNNMRFMFTDLMLFPDEYRKLKYLTPEIKRNFVALHFHRDKINMLTELERLKVLAS